MKKFVIAGLSASFVLIALFIILIVVPSLSSETVSRRYTIDTICEAGVKDIVFSNREDSVLLYINRGLEEYSLDYFQSRLLNKPALFTFSLNEAYKANPVLKIECDGEVIYTF